MIIVCKINNKIIFKEFNNKNLYKYIINTYKKDVIEFIMKIIYILVIIFFYNKKYKLLFLNSLIKFLFFINIIK